MAIERARRRPHITLQIYRCGQMCDFVGMAQTVCVLPPAEDRERLLAIVADRNRPLKHVKRRAGPSS